MGTFRAGQWIIILLVYFVIFFISVYSIMAIKAWAFESDPNYENPNGGLLQLEAILGATARCVPPTELSTFLTTTHIHCQDLLTTNATCITIEGCTWDNESIWITTNLDQPECEGRVNLTHYGMNCSGLICTGGNPDFENLFITQDTICRNLDTQSLCQTFRCTWMNSTDPYSLDYENPAKQFSVVNEAVKTMFGFKTELGFQSQLGALLFAFFFTYLEGLMLIYSFYMAIRGS